MPPPLSFPSWLSPELVPGLPFRWFGLALILALGLTYALSRHELRRITSPWASVDLLPVFLWGFLGALVGARLLWAFLYEPTRLYYGKPWLVLWPFAADGRFLGLYGLSFHGGLLGAMAATAIYAKARGLSWLELADTVSLALPLGLGLGQLGNFANGDLYGRISDASWAMVFPHAPTFSAREVWVQEFANKVGIPLSSMNDLVNLPRFPSQLVEAGLEGLVLWLLLWFLARKARRFRGQGLGLFLLGYGLLRFLAEYLRAPDPGLGFVLALGDPKAQAFALGSPLNLSMGQLLCLATALAGALLLAILGTSSRRTAPRT